MTGNATTGKIVIRAQLMALSPLHIGCGSDDRSDMDVLLDHEGQPFIPATSFVGVLRHAVRLEAADRAAHKDDIERFWGFSKGTQGQQSAFLCSDLGCVTEMPRIAIRDGIRIDNKIGMVMDKGKFDYEVIEKGAIFDLNMTFTLKEHSQIFTKKMIGTLWKMLQQNRIKVGGKTNSGLGEVALIQPNSHLYEFDLTKKRDVYSWLIRQLPSGNRIGPDALGVPFAIPSRTFSMDVTLRIKNSLIIRSYSEDPAMPDATHITSGDDWVLTGTSLKGAIRARAERIVDTLGKSESIVKSLFGHVDDQNRSKTAKRGRIRVKEVLLPRYFAELQNRIKIDRFTGGTVESALFDSMPLFPNMQDKALQVKIRIQDFKPHEAGLLLLVLKDLWSGDLAVGGEKNVGRGVFEGIGAIIEFDDEQVSLGSDLDTLPATHRSKLEDFVNALISEN